MRRTILVLCCLVLMGSLAMAQQAQWTIWEMPSSKSSPGDLVWMVDDSLFISLHSPQALARFEPEANRLIAWRLDVDPGEFVWTNSGLLFTSDSNASVGWLQADVNHVEYWQLPSPMEEPIFAVNASFGDGVENMWYLDWNQGRLGLFEPSTLAIPLQEGPQPQVISLSRTSSTVVSSSQTVSPEVHKADQGLVQRVYSSEPSVSAPFREWNIATIDPPPYAFVEDNEGHVWIPDAAAGTLLSLEPAKNSVTAHWLPENLTITSLAVGPDGANVYFLAVSDDMVPMIGVLQLEHDSVITWDIPDAEEIDALGLISTEDALWFCDRSGSAVYEFVPASGAFTWWATGGDDGPLYIVSGNPGEFWVSWEDSGKIARLAISSSTEASETGL